MCAHAQYPDTHLLPAILDEIAFGVSSVTHPCTPATGVFSLCLIWVPFLHPHTQLSDEHNTLLWSSLHLILDVEEAVVRRTAVLPADEETFLKTVYADRDAFGRFIEELHTSVQVGLDGQEDLQVHCAWGDAFLLHDTV